MRKTILLPFVLLAVLASCQKQNPPQSTEVNENAVVNESVTPEKTSDSTAVTALACDKGYAMNVSWPEGPASEKIKVEVIKGSSSEIVEMTKATPADGAKYQAADGRFIWNKGKEWTYGKGEEKLCGCAEK